MQSSNKGTIVARQQDQSRDPFFGHEANQPSYAYNPTHVGFLLDLFNGSEDGGEMFRRNIRRLSTHYTVLYPRGQNSSKSRL
jgi:hypothetical protein